MFRTQYQSHDRVHVEPGSGDKLIYSPYYTDDGRLELEVSGKENLYEFIQSHAEGVDIHVILARFAQSGDPDILNRAQGFSLDATTMPKTYAEALNAMIHAETYFNSLPVETRARFDHSFQVFLASMDQPGFLTKLGIINAAVAEAGIDVPAAGAPAAPAPAPAESGSSVSSSESTPTA
ncbi:internal scaffolding protein [Sigmofec virus UA08Rod_5712]|uniref:Internal scaffolding protein n=1 Tax=Sigmofec virus UA08Rod_5712 TaxID=2929438 RepID=A0A976R6W7_9VIRU|nr:internal scaffolding protein [Sigmofec virus UA08Rod_5712]